METDRYLNDLQYLAGSVGGGHPAPGTLGDVHDDDPPVRRLVEDLQQFGAVVGGVPSAERLQHDPMNGGQEERPDLKIR